MHVYNIYIFIRTYTNKHTYIYIYTFVYGPSKLIITNSKKPTHNIGTHCNTLQHNAALCNTMLQHTAVNHRLMWFSADTRYWDTFQHTATHCNTLQHTAIHCNTLQNTSAHCNTLQHTAIHCKTSKPHELLQFATDARYWVVLQHTATHSNTLQYFQDPRTAAIRCWHTILSRTATHCNAMPYTRNTSNTHELLHFAADTRYWVALQHTATQCHTLEILPKPTNYCNLLLTHDIGSHYNTLQRNAIHSKYFQHPRTAAICCWHTILGLTIPPRILWWKNDDLWSW